MSEKRGVNVYITNEGPLDSTLLAKSEKALHLLLRQVNEISRQVRNEQVSEVAEFILGNAGLRVMEQQAPDTLFLMDYRMHSNYLPAHNEPNLLIAFFIERVGIMDQFRTEKGSFAHYCRKVPGRESAIGNFIALRDPENFTPLFQAVNLFHEAKHALDDLRNPNYAKLSHHERELPAHHLELLIMKHYGGRALQRTVNRYVAKIKKKTAKAPNRATEILQDCRDAYDPHLDRIFGNAASEFEKYLRMDRLIYGFACNCL